MNRDNSVMEVSVQKDHRFKEIQSILYLLQESLERFKNEADSSYDLHLVGTKTPLVERIETYINDPLKSVIETSNGVDMQVRGLISRLVDRFLVSNAELIESACVAKSANNDLYYAIALKEDTVENRSAIFDFFELYDKLEIYSRYPVFFQFVPMELMGKIHVASPINLQKGAKSSHRTGEA